MSILDFSMIGPMGEPSEQEKLEEAQAWGFYTVEEFEAYMDYVMEEEMINQILEGD